MPQDLKVFADNVGTMDRICRAKTHAPWRFSRNKKGQTLVEYALILAFISVVAISVNDAQNGGVTAPARNH
jgi:Flp pilus assembly pilin Flp